MDDELRNLSSPLSFASVTAKIDQSSRQALYERPPSACESPTQQPSEDSQFLSKNELTDVHRPKLCVCRLWQLLLTLNGVILVTTVVLLLLLLFIIGPLSPYGTYGQSCQTLSCNPSQGLTCVNKSICLCPSFASYWSRNETICQRCPTGWSMLNGKCLFISTFNLNWTDASTYCNSHLGQLLTFSTTKFYISTNFFATFAASNLYSSTSNYFIGLSEQPLNSGYWQWVDGSPLLSSSAKWFCTNGSTNAFDTIFRTNMNCAMYRGDSCLARYTCQRADIHFICEKI